MPTKEEQKIAELDYFLELAKAALEFYAKSSNYHSNKEDGTIEVLYDNGETALRTIEKIDPKLYKKLNPDF